ncbi:hypothetical protein GLUCOINTEAF2_0203463 [Komagataeibacter intermedius AF2]|uniref:Uncharacterized protein n=1 Tax=Komagataeibacter intermedius AF2 TaxID=1458464 RepID=A0A0N1FLV4_9PROT|nr:hypothetical protein GLUCOINTEAF2_0203463 [Komagataeibacter intermedius AF2]
MRVTNGRGRCGQFGDGIGRRHLPPVPQPQDGQRCTKCYQIDRDHDRGIAIERNAKEIGADDVHQIGDDQRQAGGVRDEAGRYDEGQGCSMAQAELSEDGDDNGREQQGRAVIGENRCNGRSQHHDQRE